MSYRNRWWYGLGAVSCFTAAFAALQLPIGLLNPWQERFYSTSAAFFILVGSFLLWRFYRAGPIRFSVRQLLIATVVVAVHLGLLSWFLHWMGLAL